MLVLQPPVVSLCMRARLWALSTGTHIRRSCGTSTAGTPHAVASAGFGATVIDSYERGRPTYSEADTELLLRSSGTCDNSTTSAASLYPARPILELACGTGKFTRPLVRTLERIGGPGAAANVLLVDPAGMGAHAAATFPKLPFVRTTADSLGHLADGSVHAVVAAQAFHWFADSASLREISRVLRPKGQLLLIWNKRDREASPLMAALEALLDESYALADTRGSPTPRHNTGNWRAVFDGAEERSTWDELHSMRVTRPYDGTADEFVDWILSISVVSQRDAAAKVEIAARTRRLLEEHPNAVIPHDRVATTSSMHRYTVPLFTELVWTSKLL